MALHVHGSSNPLGITGNIDRLPMHPYFIFKDLITVFVFLLAFALFVFFSPNTLGHPDNYIPGNPLVTPASIENPFTIILNFTLLLTILFLLWTIHFSNENVSNISIYTKNNMTKENLKFILNNKPDYPKDNNDIFKDIINGLYQAEGNLYYNFNNTTDYRGSVKWSISLNATNKSIELFQKLNNVFDNQLNYEISLTDNDNYHIRVWTKKNSLIINKIKPYLSNIYGDKYRSLIYFMKIQYLLDKLNKLSYNKNTEEYIDLITKIIYLVYHTVDNSQRKLDLESKLKLVLSNYNIKHYEDYIKNKTYYFNYIQKILDDYPNSKFKINFVWLLGFFLGDGNILIYLRNQREKSTTENIFDFWFVHMIRINQKLTPFNKELFLLIQEYLLNNDINVGITLDHKQNKIEIKLENTKDIKLILKHFSKYYNYWFNKTLDLHYLDKIINLDRISKYWPLGLYLRILYLRHYKYIKYISLDNNNFKLQLLSIEEIEQDLLNIINNNNSLKKVFLENKQILSNNDIKKILKLNITHNKYYYPMSFNDTTKLLIFSNIYEDIIKLKFKDLDENKNENELQFISIFKNLGYKVKLPIKIKPKEKYFYFSTWGTKEKALLQAKLYKFNNLIEWIKKYLNN